MINYIVIEGTHKNPNEIETINKDSKKTWIRSKISEYEKEI